jgi:hypothetical protein
MKMESFLQSLENIGLTKCISHYDDFVQKFSFSDCDFAFITVWKKIRKCIIWSNIHIIDGEIRVTELDKHQYDIDSEGSVIITKLKELIILYKQMRIELKMKELNKDFV